MAFITITVRNNADYCDDNGLTSWSICQCVCTFDGVAEPDCVHCKGSGQLMVAKRPCEMQLSSVRFEHLFRCLGFDPVPGRCDGRILARKLAALKPERLETDSIRIVHGGVSVHTGKVDGSTAVLWHAKLSEIANHAESREEPVVWG
jgi:hypothetical protein